MSLDPTRVRMDELAAEIEQVRRERDGAREELAIVEADAKAAFGAVVPGWDSPSALLIAHDRLAKQVAQIREARAHECGSYCTEGGCDFDLGGFVDQVDEILGLREPVEPLAVPFPTGEPS